MADATAYRLDISTFVSQDAASFLKTKLLLILHRAHARDIPKPLMKAGRAHAHTSGEILDSK